MQAFDFLEPVSLEKPEEHLISSPNIFGKNITINTADFELKELDKYDVIILGIPEDRNSFNKGASLAPDKIRAELFKFIKIGSTVKILDIGNVIQGNTFSDTYVAVKEVLLELVSKNLVVILLGGTQELTIPIFQAFENIKSKINLTTIDRRFDIEKDSLKINSESYLTEILFKKRYLFQYCNLGHQAHLSDKESIELINKMNFEALRLGQVRGEMSSVEPFLRDSDIVSFDISALRMSDSPGHLNASPSGFTSEEACQLSRYAGISDRVMAFGIFEMNPRFDNNAQSAKMVAQMLWYFIDGYSCRNKETPDSENKNFKTFIVGHSDLDYEITFFKSLLTERWWMEVPNQKEKSSLLVSCSYADYQSACEQEVPDLWWKSYQKLS